LKLGNTLAVIFHCEKVLKIDENNCKALYRIAVAFTKRGEYDKAEESLRKALKLEPNNSEMRALSEEIKKERKDYKESQKVMGKKMFGSTSNKSTLMGKISNMIWYILLMIITYFKRIIFDPIWNLLTKIINTISSLWIIQFLIKMYKSCINLIKKPFTMIHSLIKKVFALPREIVMYLYSWRKTPIKS